MGCVMWWYIPLRIAAMECGVSCRVVVCWHVVLCDDMGCVVLHYVMIRCDMCCCVVCWCVVLRCCVMLCRVMCSCMMWVASSCGVLWCVVPRCCVVRCYVCECGVFGRIALHCIGICA